MKLTNNEIYNYAINLQEVFIDETQKLPVKISFYLLKNKNILLELAKDIEQTRLSIVQNYGELNLETNQYIVAPEDVPAAQKELSELLSLEQEVQIYKININDFPSDLNLTSGQMEKLMFMIDD